MVELVSREGRSVFVKGLDAIDGLPSLISNPSWRSFAEDADQAYRMGYGHHVPLLGIRMKYFIL